MNAPSKKILIAVLLASLVYFGLFIYPNTLGAKSETMLSKTSIDEPVTYPYVVRMLTPASGLKDLWERWIIYGDYHYGYPFYFLSAVAVLPVRLAYGALFTNHTGLNLFLLRQLISVLPMVLACVLMVYAATRFRSGWLTFGLLAVLFSVRGIVRNNLQWWHPDALSVLAVVLTLFFLDRDRLRFGRNYLLAAAACGFAAGIKLAGLFFFLAVAGYLVAGVRRKALTWKRAAGKGALFVAVMLAAMVLSNPELYNSGARKELVNIQLYKSTELEQGYSDASIYYSKGPQYWEWTLSRWFGTPWMLAFAVLSIAAGCLWGPNRRLNLLILGWIIPYSVYLLWFVAVKPDHYWLPVMIPLYSGLLNLPLILLKGPRPGWIEKKRINLAVSGLVFLLAVGFLFTNFTREGSGIIPQAGAALRVEQTLK